MTRTTVVVDVVNETVRWPKRSGYSERQEDVLRRRLIHTAHHAGERGTSQAFEHLVWNDNTPCLVYANVRELDGDIALAELESPRPFDPAAAFGPVALRFFELMREIVVLSDTEPSSFPGPRIVFVNRAFERMTGYQASEILGRTPRMLQGEQTCPETRKMIGESLARWDSVSTEVRNYRKNGTPFDSEITIYPVTDETGWYTYWCSLQRDVTEERERTAQLRNARDQALAASRAKSE
ncbi:MAG: PAS domain-containing protein, partial [Myxococcota bacterium]